jgi:hypothetical protein
MKKILIIAKMDMFKKENSQNRYNFLNFLNTKSNIRVIEDLPRTLNQTLEKLNKNHGFDPQIIIYYALSAHSKWNDVKIKNIEISDKPIYLFFEDFHYKDSIVKLYNKYKFTGLIIPSSNPFETIEVFKNENIYCLVWGFFINTDEFYINQQVDKKYDILFYGYLHPTCYSLRCKIHFYLKQIKEKYPLSKIKIIDHPGYKQFSKETPRGHDLSVLLNKSKFAIATSSFKSLFVKKYLEIPLSGCHLVGDVPAHYKELLSGNILEIKRREDDNIIFKKIIDILNGKYDYLLDKTKMNKFADKLKKEYSFEAGYEKLCIMFDSP